MGRRRGEDCSFCCEEEIESEVYNIFLQKCFCCEIDQFGHQDPSIHPSIHLSIYSVR